MNSNKIHFSSLLPQQFPSFSEQLEKTLLKHQITYGYLENTKDIWCRDYMPIQVRENEMVLFRYYPSYLKGVPILRTNNKLVCEKMGINYQYSPIILDGGNVVRFKNKTILTDRIFSENNVKIGDKNLLNQLEKLLQSEIIIIPSEKEDVVGHADGMVRFIDENTVFVNDYFNTKSSVSFQKKLYNSLSKHHVEIIPFPYFPDEKWQPKYKSDVPPATGVYINYLHVEDMIVLPQFKIKTDEIACNISKRYFKKVVPLDCRKLALYGGVLNCISWEIT